MKTKSVLEFKDVKAILAAAEAEALKNNWAVVISVVDDGGNLLALSKLDGVAPISCHIAPAKAKTANGTTQSRRMKTPQLDGDIAFIHRLRSRPQSRTRRNSRKNAGRRAARP